MIPGEDGGATYHQRFRTHEFVRGQEGDWWKGDAEKLRDINYPDREIFPPIKTPGKLTSNLLLLVIYGAFLTADCL